MKKLKHIAFNSISILAIITCILYILNHFNTQMNMGHWLILIILEAAIQTVIELNIRT